MSLGSASDSPITIQSGREVSEERKIEAIDHPTRLRRRAFATRMTK
jgi:hypothetical protein